MNSLRSLHPYQHSSNFNGCECDVQEHFYPFSLVLVSSQTRKLFTDVTSSLDAFKHGLNANQGERCKAGASVQKEDLKCSISQVNVYRCTNFSDSLLQLISFPSQNQQTNRAAATECHPKIIAVPEATVEEMDNERICFFSQLVTHQSNVPTSFHFAVFRKKKTYLKQRDTSRYP